jgi:large conductance mechanosensitive channel
MYHFGEIVAEEQWESPENSPYSTIGPHGAKIVWNCPVGRRMKNTNMLKDFKAFVMKGNVLDLAVAVIIGGAFGAIVTSLVNDVIMPPIGMILGHIDFKELFLSLNGQTYASLADAKKVAAPVIAYGMFLNTVINFLIVALVIFMVVRAASKLQHPAPVPDAAPTTKDCSFCFTAIPILAKRCPNCTSQLS